MLHVDLDNILTHDELATKAEEVLRKADDENKIVVITRNGRPAVAVLKLEQLEELSGRPVSTQQIPNIVAGPAETPVPVAPMPETHSEAPAPLAETPAPDTSGLPPMPDQF